MASYELSLNLIGGEKVESILQKLQGLTGALGQGGSIFGGGQSGGTSPISKQADDVARLTKQVQAGTVGVHALGRELKNLGQSPGASFLTGAALSKSDSFWKNNPKFAQMMNQGGAWATGGASPGGKDNGDKYALAGSRLNIAMKMKEARDAAKASLDGSKANIRMKMLEAKENAMQEAQGNAQATAASRLNIAMKMRAAMDAAKSAQDATTFKKDMSFLMMPLFNPGSMWATLFSGRQTYSALSGDAGKEFLAGKSGGLIGMLGGKLGKLSGGSAGAATGLLVGGATVLGLALKALTVTVKQTMAAYENARQIYAKALTNGMGTQFTVKRSMLAQIMGVSEQDVFRFGAQMAYLNPKLEWAANILSRTTTPLTQVSWEFKILGENTKAMFSSLSVEAAPALLVFTNSLSNLVKYITEHAHDFNKLMLGNGWVKETSQEIKDRQDQNFTDENYKAYSGRLPNGKTVGIGSGPLEKLMPDTGSGHYADDFRKRFEKLTLKQFEKITSGKGIENNKASEIYSWIKHPPGKGGDSDSSMPSPQAWMKQLPASHWEKMGLVTMGGGQNYAKDTAKNTRDIANGIKTLVAAAKSRSGAKSPWDMSPNTAQPG
jgi:hypothetical protein